MRVGQWIVEDLVGVARLTRVVSRPRVCDMTREVTAVTERVCILRAEFAKSCSRGLVSWSQPRNEARFTGLQHSLSPFEIELGPTSAPGQGVSKLTRKRAKYLFLRLAISPYPALSMTLNFNSTRGIVLRQSAHTDSRGCSLDHTYIQSVSLS